MLIAQVGWSADRYWVGGSSGVWNSTDSWSDASGGSTGATSSASLKR